MEPIVIRRRADFSGVRVAVFDFDGTISSLRCGWEDIMEQLMRECLAGGDLAGEALTAHIRAYIDESTGIQTIYQMEWLAGQVRRLRCREPLNPWAYKDLYNARLLQMVNDRIAALASGARAPEQFLVPGSRAFVQMLREMGVEIHIASGTDDADVRREAELLGIRPLASAVRGAPHRRKDCSKEAVIRDILATNALRGAQLLVVGDGKVEIQLGHEVGAITLGIASDEQRFGGHFHPKKLAKLTAAQADYIAADFIAPLQALRSAHCALDAFREKR